MPQSFVLPFSTEAGFLCFGLMLTEESQLKEKKLVLEMEQWLRALVTIPEDPSVCPAFPWGQTIVTRVPQRSNTLF